MTTDEYMERLLTCYWIAGALAGLPLAEMVAAISYAESVGPIMAPTLYRDKATEMSEDAVIVRALLKCQAELRRVPVPQLP